MPFNNVRHGVFSLRVAPIPQAANFTLRLTPPRAPTDGRLTGDARSKKQQLGSERVTAGHHPNPHAFRAAAMVRIGPACLGQCTDSPLPGRPVLTRLLVSTPGDQRGFPAQACPANVFPRNAHFQPCLRRFLEHCPPQTHSPIACAYGTGEENYGKRISRGKYYGKILILKK